jgi:hypothetical protein
MAQSWCRPPGRKIMTAVQHEAEADQLHLADRTRHQPRDQVSQAVVEALDSEGPDDGAVDGWPARRARP